MEVQSNNNLINKDHAIQVCCDLMKFLEEGFLCDTVILTEDNKIYAHSLILASFSSLFSKLFRDQETNGKTKEYYMINLKNYTYEVVERLLAFAYTGKLAPIFDPKIEEEIKNLLFVVKPNIVHNGNCKISQIDEKERNENNNQQMDVDYFSTKKLNTNDIKEITPKHTSIDFKNKNKLNGSIKTKLETNYKQISNDILKNSIVTSNKSENINKDLMIIKPKYTNKNIQSEKKILNRFNAKSENQNLSNSIISNRVFLKPISKFYKTKDSKKKNLNHDDKNKKKSIIKIKYRSIPLKCNFKSTSKCRNRPKWSSVISRETSKKLNEFLLEMSKQIVVSPKITEPVIYDDLFLNNNISVFSNKKLLDDSSLSMKINDDDYSLEQLHNIYTSKMMEASTLICLKNSKSNFELNIPLDRFIMRAINHFYIHLRRYTVCENCKKRVKKTKLKAHLEICGVQSFNCSHCSRHFKTAGFLSLHERYVHNSNILSLINFQCDLCGKYFSSKNSLNSHKTHGHIKAKAFTCPQCNKAFFRKKTFENHIAAHSDKRPYACNICGKEYKTTKSLSVHINVHEAVKPFKCPICSKRFTIKSNLKRHLKIHQRLDPKIDESDVDNEIKYKIFIK